MTKKMEMASCKASLVEYPKGCGGLPGRIC